MLCVSAKDVCRDFYQNMIKILVMAMVEVMITTAYGSDSVDEKEEKRGKYDRMVS